MTVLQKLLDKKKAERLTIKEISSILDIPITRINGWIRNTTEPKHSDGIKIDNWLNGKINTQNKDLNIAREDREIYLKTNNSDRLLDVIEKLTNTNAEQQKTIATLVDKLGNAVAQTKAG
jgi:hypothetical protein